MQQAITLLDYANSHGQTNEQFLNLVEEHRAVKLDVNSDERVQLSALENELQENSLRFENNYKGKAVTFEAVVTSVGYDNLIRKMRLGFKQGEFIGSCSFPKGAIDDKLMTLNKGDKVLIAANPYVYSGILGDSLHMKNCQF